MITNEFRPQTFESMSGQEVPKQVLKNIVSNPDKAPKTLIFQGKYGTGKCILPSTRVSTSEGYLPIGSLYKADSDGFFDYTTDVVTRQGVFQSSKFYKESNCNVNLYKLDNGEVINGTDDHRVLAKHCGEVDLFPLKDLEIGDEVLFPRMPIGESYPISNPSLAYAAGAFLCRGQLYHDVMVFQGNRLECEKFAKLVGWTSVPQYIADFLFSIKPKDTDKSLLKLDNLYSIPDFIFRSDISTRIAFLQAFIDFIGDIRVNTIVFKFLTIQLIGPFYELLHSLGITPNLDHTHNFIQHNNNEVVVSCRALSKFNLYKSGFKISVEQVVESVNSATISDCIFNHLQSLDVSDYNIGMRLIKSVKLYGVISESQYREYLDFYGSVPEQLKYLFYDRVKISDKKQIVSDVYDLSVPEIHEFFAQGTFNHNTTAARIFARALNCEDKSSPEPCGECESCKKDVNSAWFYKEYDSSIVGKIDVLRELRDTFYISIKNGWQVIVFDESHIISSACQAALLKILEDGIDRTFFILATTDADKLLNTIRSRSLELYFDGISKDKMKDNLIDICHKKYINIDDNVLNIITSRARGHMRDAHKMLDLYILLGHDKFCEFYKDISILFYDYFDSIVTQDKEKLFSTLKLLSCFPLAEITQEFKEFSLEFAKSLVSLPSNINSDLVSKWSQNGHKLLRVLVSDWVSAGFRSDIELQTTLLAIYQLFMNSVSTSVSNNSSSVASVYARNRR